DTVAGLLAVARCEQAIGEVVNLGSNYEISIKDTIGLIAEIAGARVEVETDDARVRPAASEVERLRADNSKAKRLLKWEPQYAGVEGLRRGIAATLDWLRTDGRLDRYKAARYNV